MADRDEWSEQAIDELTRFVLKRHKAGAAFFARSRAAMFEESGDVADAGRWRAVAARIERMGQGSVVALRRPRGGEP